LGDVASKLFLKLLKENSIILYSELTLKELRKCFADEEINSSLGIILALGLLEKAKVAADELEEAAKLAKTRKVPFGDALHAIIARNNDAIMVSPDKHFELLKDIVDYKRPEDLIWLSNPSL